MWESFMPSLNLQGKLELLGHLKRKVMMKKSFGAEQETSQEVGTRWAISLRRLVQNTMPIA
eukprot:6281510-Ditylum_brightwellii.AAC.1